MGHMIPDTQRYWIQEGQLRLTKPEDVPQDVQSWAYGDVFKGRDEYAVFLGDLRTAGLPDVTIWQLMQERGAGFWL